MGTVLLELSFKRVGDAKPELADCGGCVVQRSANDRLREAARVGVLDQIKALDERWQIDNVIAGHAARRVVDIDGRDPTLADLRHWPDALLGIGREHQDAWRRQIVKQITD